MSYAFLTLKGTKNLRTKHELPRNSSCQLMRVVIWFHHASSKGLRRSRLFEGGASTRRDSTSLRSSLLLASGSVLEEDNKCVNLLSYPSTAGIIFEFDLVPYCWRSRMKSSSNTHQTLHTMSPYDNIFKHFTL